MTTKRKKKPGPPPTGLSRTIPLLLMLDKDENEHLNRLVKEAKNKNSKIHKAAQIIRQRVFRRGELERLRAEQGANIL